MSTATAAAQPRYIKVSSAGALLPFEATEWEGVYIPAAEITVPRQLLLPGTGNWQWAQDQCAAVRLCGWDNWHSISRDEFTDHLDDAERSGPCVDTDFFTVSDRYAWAWTRDEAPRGCAIAVNLYDGYVGRYLQSDHCSALACRPGQLFWSSVPGAAVQQAHTATDANIAGMTLRQHYAGRAMQALAGAICKMDDIGIITHRPVDVAQIAVVYADALIAELEKLR